MRNLTHKFFSFKYLALVTLAISLMCHVKSSILNQSPVQTAIKTPKSQVEEMSGGPYLIMNRKRPEVRQKAIVPQITLHNEMNLK